MVEESDIVGFLKDHKGQASLEEISEGLGILKYGPNSAYALRVPKIVRFRLDKKVEEIDSLEKLSKLYEMQYERYPSKSF